MRSLSLPTRLGGLAASALAFNVAVFALQPQLQAEVLQRLRSPQVRLLVPLETGHELGLLLPFVPSAQLVELDGNDYVLLGTFTDARVAYRLGRTFQSRSNLSFELAYEAGHAQSDGNWLAQERSTGPGGRHLTRRQSLPTKPLVTNRSPGSVGSVAMASTTPDTASQAALVPARASERGGPVEMQAADRGAELPPPVPQPDRSSALAAQAVALPADRFAFATPQDQAAALSQIQASPSARSAHAHLLKPVPIAPVALFPVVLRRPQLLAGNPSLNYLFVRLPSQEELPELHRHSPVLEVGELDGQLMARVGVFTTSRTGRQLLDHQIDLLTGMGYDVQLIRSLV